MYKALIIRTHSRISGTEKVFFHELSDLEKLKNLGLSMNCGYPVERK